MNKVKRQIKQQPAPIILRGKEMTSLRWRKQREPSFREYDYGGKVKDEIQGSKRASYAKSREKSVSGRGTRMWEGLKVGKGLTWSKN